MQDEILKHTKQAYKELKNPKHTLGEKAKEIIVEIFIIVFAVSLSIWLHSWSEHRHQQEEVSVFLGNLKNDLKNDIVRLNEDKSGYQQITKHYEMLLNLTPHQLDSLKQNKNDFRINLYNTGKKTNDGNYEGFKSSGKIGNIENLALKQLIVTYYQQCVPLINSIDEKYLDFGFKIVEFEIEYAGQKDKLNFSNPQLRERLKYTILIGKGNIRHYDQEGIKVAQEIIGAIDKELQK
jgi:hypothetical protein